MNILTKIINKLKVKKVVSEEQSIVSLDSKIIYLPDYQDLTLEDKIKVDNYKKEININNFDTLINYTNELREKGKNETGLLINFLYELEQVLESLTIKKDLGKEIKINQYELVDYEIKLAKIISLNNILKEKRKELELRLLGLLKYKEEYQKHNLKHNIEYLGIFGRDKKLKREMEERGLRNLENTLRVAIIALDSNLEISRNSIEKANNLITDLKTYESKKINYYSIRDTKFYDKLSFYKATNELIFENKLKGIEDLDIIMRDNHLSYNDIIPFKLAYVELQIDLEKDKYKDKFINYFKNQYNEILNTPNTLDNVNNLIKKINELLVIQELYQEDISKYLRNKLYEMKFFLLSKKFISDAKIEYTTYEEKKYYLDIIKNEYKQFRKLNSDTAKFIKDNIEWLLKNNSLSNILLKTHPNYLKIILLVNYPSYFKEFFDSYIESSKARWFDIEYDSNLGNNRSLIIDNKSKEYLLKNHKNIKLDKQKIDGNWYYRPKYDFLSDFNLYRRFALDIIYTCKKYILIDDLITIKNDTLTFAEGITKITFNHMSYQSKKLIKHIKFPESLREIGDFAFEGFKNLEEVNCPPLLEVIDFNAFENCLSLKKITFNSKLKVIGSEAFSNCYSLRKVVFPSSLEIIGCRAFDYCPKLKSIIFEGAHPKKILERTFFMTDANFDDIVWQSELEEIDENAFNENIENDIIDNYEKLPKTLKRIANFKIENGDLKEDEEKVKKLI